MRQDERTESGQSRDTIDVCKLQTLMHIASRQMHIGWRWRKRQRLANFAFNLSLTMGGTKAETSPPMAATWRTSVAVM